MAEKTVLLCHYDDSKADDLQRATSLWMRNLAKKLNRRRGVRASCVNYAEPDAITRLSEGAVFLLALCGHGRRSDGALLGMRNRPVLTHRDKRCLENCLTLAPYCYSSILWTRAFGAVDGAMPTPIFMGFRGEFWLVTDASGVGCPGFEESVSAAVDSLLRNRSAVDAAKALMEVAADVCLQHLCDFFCASCARDAARLITSFECVLALLNNMRSVYPHGKQVPRSR